MDLPLLLSRDDGKKSVDDVKFRIEKGQKRDANN